MSNYTTCRDWVQTTLEATLSSLDASSKGAHVTDAMVNADTEGHVHYETPADYREVETAFTGGEYVNYYVDVRYRVAGDEAATETKAEAFADALRSTLHQKKASVGSGITHNDTEVIWGAHKAGEWDAAQLHREAVHRVRIHTTEMNP